MDMIMLYTTVKDAEEAEKIQNVLVKEKLVACCIVIPNISSCYWWKGKVETSNEAILIAKTKKSLMKEAIEKVREVHSYAIPCVLALTVIDANPDYLQWLDEVTK